MAGRAPGLAGERYLEAANQILTANERMENELTEIDSVTLELGEVSGVVSDYLKDCWAWYAKKTPLIQNASLEFETIPAITWCNACKTTYPTVQYGKTCPNCGSGETWLQQGNEMNIKQIVAC